MRLVYDVCVGVGRGSDSQTFNIAAVGADLAAQGIFALIGWDILGACTLLCDGPQRTYTLGY